MSLIEKLENKEGFTVTEAALADFIIENIATVHEMTLQEFAEAAYVSKPSVIRLYRKLGFDSFRDFSVTLQLERIRAEDERMIESSRVFKEARSLHEYAEKIGTLSKQITDTCISSIDQENLNGIVYGIKNAERIFVYADKNIMNEASSFCSRLMSSNNNTVMLNRNGRKLPSVLNGNDAVIIILSDTVTQMGSEVVKRIMNSAALKILITTRKDPEFTYKPDYWFYTYPNANEFIQNNLLISQMSLLTGMNLIYSCLNKALLDEKWHRVLENNCKQNKITI
ncbi:MAG: MurR/RpiR family transcriptional regulator [Erysipelotrichaceae bacterium]|nr:MurR/RpiR family transcriptional regulator [Erysipelotrichaceae bacterium]